MRLLAASGKFALEVAVMVLSRDLGAGEVTGEHWGVVALCCLSV